MKRTIKYNAYIWQREDWPQFHINDLISKGMLLSSHEGGRNTNYLLPD